MSGPDADLVRLSTPEPGIRLIELCDLRRYNALSAEMTTALKNAFATVAGERDTRAVILRGDSAGRGFCAGADLSGQGGDAPDTQGRGRVGVVQRSQDHLAGLILQIHELRQPVIAAVHGAAVGGGLALALAADIRVASHDAFFSAQFVKVGLSSCDVGTSYLLPRIVGAGHSIRLMLTGRRCGAAEAARIGLVTALCDRDDLLETALVDARAIASLSEFSVEFTKLGAWANLDAASLRHAMELENRTQVLGTMTGNMAIAARAFVEGTDPEWLPL
jgi:enoyl-CoA hydratase